MYPTDTEVLIVGAGPVGLFEALLLHARGTKVVVVERQKQLYPLPRAVAFDHEARRGMESIGLGRELEDVLEEIVCPIGGENGTNFLWRDKNMKVIVDLKWEEATASGYPIAMGFTQPQLEGLLERAVLTRGIPLIRGYALHDIVHSFENVAGRFRYVPGKDGSLTNGHGSAELDIHAKYLIGCDGANSTVRKLMQIENTDLGFENDWLVLDLLPRDGYIPPKVQKIGNAQICDPARPTTVVFGGDKRRRFEFMRLPGESTEELLSDEKMWELLGAWGYTPDKCDLERKVIYTFKARWANEFTKGRVLLAGDALHLMPPFIGQGLNSGFRDAAAIAWRIPLVLEGLASREAAFLSYQNERLEHLVKITKHCILLGEAICETDPFKSAAMHTDLRNNPPPKGFDPPLGRPGILTDQAYSGRLSLHRKLKRQADGQEDWFDHVHGYGWRLITFDRNSPDEFLEPKARQFFIEQLGGRVANITKGEDYTGDYAIWFETVGSGSAILVRPDYYVYGYAPLEEVSDLVLGLKIKLSM